MCKELDALSEGSGLLLAEILLLNVLGGLVDKDLSKLGDLDLIFSVLRDGAAEEMI